MLRMSFFMKTDKHSQRFSHQNCAQTSLLIDTSKNDIILFNDDSNKVVDHQY